MTVTYKGKVNGDSMAGDVQMGDFGSMTWTAVRKKALFSWFSWDIPLCQPACPPDRTARGVHPSVQLLSMVEC